MKLSVAEILKKVSSLRTKDEKIQALRANNSFALRTVLTGAFDKRIKWLLPQGEVPYKKSDLKDLEHVLYAEARKLYLFVEGGSPGLSQLRRETLFIELLEGLSPDDAELMTFVKDKKIPYKGITPALVREAFPGLMGDEQEL
jgi:hypothetical protein